MATNVVMPQMGESVAEGTIVRWIKKVGDEIGRDEPLFEISTDKVDAEIPSPAAGVLSEIRVKEGETVPVDTVVAVIGQKSEQSNVIAPPPARPAPSDPAPPNAAPAAAQISRADSGPSPSPAPPAPPAPVPQPTRAPETHEAAPDDRARQRSSPLVRKIAKEHNIDIAQIPGTGIAGRVTKDDILGFIAHSSGDTAAAAPAPAPAAPPPPRSPGAPLPGQVQPMSVMRKKIAEHMIASRRTSAHVHSVFEVNFARVSRVREARKAEYERAGVKLTYLAFIVRATADALRAVPVINASIDGENIVYHREVNIGIAVALDWGLIVPVMKSVDERNLLGISRALTDLAARARAKQLNQDDVTGGTFTITNPGVFGALSGTPIINQPQVAILGVGAIEKRPVVIDDAIAIRPMGYLTIGYDHRLIDGAVADQFMSHLKNSLETWPE
jgi:pyruvate dehydrogenase E2 component (dihydrolipoamide acetyltransferase)